MNDLPLEILIEILDTVLAETLNVPSFEGGHYLSTLKDLEAVCRIWKSVIQSTPRFWAVIESNITPDEMEYMLYKSGKCALTFRHIMEIVPGSGLPPKSGLDGYDILELASRNMDRCSSLTVWLEDDRLPAKILQSPAPMLREATVIAEKNYIEEGIILFDGQAEMLEDLDLTCIPIRWDVVLPSKLRRIKISYQSSPLTWPPNPHQIVSALSNCTGLEVLELSSAYIPQRQLEWADLEVPGPIIELPMLKELRIMNMSIVGSGYLTGHLWAPDLRYLKVIETVQAGSVAPLFRPSRRLLLESIRRALARSEILRFHIKSKRNYLAISGAGGDVLLLICYMGQDELGDWLLAEFASELSCVPELELLVWSTDPEAKLETLRKLLKALNNLVRFRFRCECASGEVGVVAEHLGLPYQASDGWHWHWPRLGFLELVGTHCWHEQALTMFRERYGVPQQEDDTPSDGSSPNGYHRPCPLATLSLGSLKNLYPNQFRDIVNVVGKDVLEEDIRERAIRQI